MQRGRYAARATRTQNLVIVSAWVCYVVACTAVITALRMAGQARVANAIGVVLAPAFAPVIFGLTRRVRHRPWPFRAALHVAVTAVAIVAAAVRFAV